MTTEAELIARLRSSDPVRLTMALLAPKSARARLLTLYALNDELARTALAAHEPIVAEMRVQWWFDRLAAMSDGAPPPHELLTPIWSAWGSGAAALAPLATARMHDASREPFETVDELIAYADATGGALMLLAAEAAGSGGAAISAQGRGAALVAWARARPALQALGLGLARPDTAALRDIAAAAEAAFDEAARLRRTIAKTTAPTLFAGANARKAIAALQAGHDPEPPSEISRRAALARLALTGRWWV